MSLSCFSSPGAPLPRWWDHVGAIALSPEVNPFTRLHPNQTFRDGHHSNPAARVELRHGSKSRATLMDARSPLRPKRRAGEAIRRHRKIALAIAAKAPPTRCCRMITPRPGPGAALCPERIPEKSPVTTSRWWEVESASDGRVKRLAPEQDRSCDRNEGKIDELVTAITAPRRALRQTFSYGWRNGPLP